jgi:hypothetical protein
VTYDYGPYGSTPFWLDGELVRNGIPLRAQLNILLKLQPSGGCERPEGGMGTVTFVGWILRFAQYPGTSEAVLLPVTTPIYPCAYVSLAAAISGVTPYCSPGTPDPAIAPPMSTEFEITGTIAGTYHRAGSHLTLDVVATLKFCPRTWNPNPPGYGTYKVDCTVPSDPAQPAVIDGWLGTPGDVQVYNGVPTGPSIYIGNSLGTWQYGA